MQLIVSSSLENRDLALLKSVVNILHSDYADDNIDNWTYAESGEHHVFITQDFYEHGSEYFALIKHQGKKISLGANINPKNLRQLFERIAEGNTDSCIDTQSTAVSNNHQSLLTHILQYMSSRAPVLMYIAGLDDTEIIIDKIKDQVWSNRPLNQKLIEQNLYIKPLNIKYLNKDKKIDHQLMKFNTLASHFLWHMGIMNHQTLIDPEFTQPYVSFKQIQWPDYGCVSSESEFITISALLWRRAETYESLHKQHGFDKPTLNSFINAACLSNACIATKNKGSTVVNMASLPVKNNNNFLNRLKQKLFGLST